MKLLYELAQDYASVLRKIMALESTKTQLHINVYGLENRNAAVEVRELLEPYLPQAIETVLKRAREEATLLKQQLDLSAREGAAGIKIVK